MVKEGDATRLYLNKSRLALVVLCSALLLAGTLFGVVQTSGADAGSWIGEGNVVDDADVSFGRFPDGEASWHTMSEVVTPSEPNQLGGITDDLVINEFMANNDAAVPGPDGDYPDWIELYNGGANSIDLSGMYLSDDLSNPDAWQFSSGAVIDAGGFLIIWADNSLDEGLLHASFALNASGEAVCLFASDAETLIDSIVFTEQPDDVSYGRLPDGASSWDYLTPTPNLANSLGEPVTPDELFINEFMANNDAAVAGPDGDYPDWIELYNGGTESIDLGGMYLSDDLANPDAWQFSSGTVIEAGGFLVIWADNSLDEGLLHASFALNASGEAVCLFASDTETLIDSISFAQQFNDVSYGRLPDGASSWDYLTATPGLSNSLGEAVTPDEPTPVYIPDDLFINEFMANNDAAVAGPDGNYPDWIELYNGGTESIDLGGMYLTDNLANPDGWPFPEGTVIDAGGFLVVWADNDPEKGPMHASFSLNASGEAVAIFATDGETAIDHLVYTEQFDDVSYARLPDGGSNWAYLTATPGSSNALGEHVTPGDPTHGVEVPGDIFINEFMANNDAAVPGPSGDYPDWIELYNGGTDSIDLSGMYLSDDLSNPDAWQFSSGAVIDAGGFLVIWADNSLDEGLLHASFALNASGEAVCLFASDTETLIDSIVFTEQPDDVSYGRLPDGASSWDYLTPTPGLPNEIGEVIVPDEPTPVGDIPDGLVINEFMADNGVTIAGPDGNNPDWIELYNGGNESVNLSGMYLTDNLGNPTKWQFPDDTIIESGGFLLIWADNASDSDGLHCSFGLRANGEEIALFASDGTTLIDSLTYTKQLQDVSYGRLPDGTENWEHLLSATPGWGNRERQFDAESSLWSVLLLVGLVGVVCVLFVVGIKLNARRR